MLIINYEITLIRIFYRKYDNNKNEKVEQKVRLDRIIIVYNIPAQKGNRIVNFICSPNKFQLVVILLRQSIYLLYPTRKSKCSKNIMTVICM